MSDAADRTTDHLTPTGGPGSRLPDRSVIGVPWPGAPLRTAVTRFWRGYRVFAGRASRSEFWWWALVDAVVVVVLEVVALLIAMPAITSVGGSGDTRAVPDGVAAGVVAVVFVIGAWRLATLLPFLALTVRRLHDTDRSGWWVLLGLVPIAQIVLVVFLVLRSDPAGARFPTRTRGVRTKQA